MKKLISTFFSFVIIICTTGFIVFSANPGYSQDIRFREWQATTSTYAMAVNFPANGIADDFGPRRFGADNWHGGIDYNSIMNDGNNDYGDLVLSPENGTIVNINRFIRTDNLAAYPVVGTGDHRYTFVHMFYNGTSTTKIMNDSTMILKYMMSPNQNRWALIMEINGTTTALGQSTGLVIFNGDTINVSNTFNQYDPIGPIGTSGGVGAHLHLNTIPTNQTSINDAHNGDPLEYVNYVQPTLQIDLYSQNNNNGITVVYPGNQSTRIASKVILLNEPLNVNRYNTVMDANTINFLIKHENIVNYQLIQGNSQSARISKGARLNEASINHPAPAFGSWTVTGIAPFAYNSTISGDPYNPQPWDIYYFTDFQIRIHKDDTLGTADSKFALCPDKARYPDGNYSMITEVLDVKNDRDSSAVEEFVLDNFKPFIQNVEVFVDEDALLVYEEEWACATSCIQFSNNSMNTEISINDINAGIWIFVTASEPLDTIVLDVPAFQISNKQPDPPLSQGDGVHFRFKIDIDEIIAEGVDVILHFTGQDRNGNELISFTNLQTSQCLSVPVRQSQTTWSNTNNLTYGIDTLHRFSLGCAAPDSLHSGKPVIDRQNTMTGTDVYVESYELEVDTNIVLPSSIGCFDGSIDVNIDGGLKPYSVLWYKNNVLIDSLSSLGNDGSEDLTEVGIGKYRIEVQDPLCGSYVKVYIVGAELAEVYADVTGIAYCSEDLEVGGMPYSSCDGQIVLQYPIELGATYAWTGPYGFTSSTKDIINLCASGEYTVTITNAECIYIDSFTVCCCYTSGGDGAGYDPSLAPIECYEELEPDELSMSATVSEATNGDSDGAISLVVSGGANMYSFLWQGPGFEAYSEDIEGLGIGEYCVTVSDGCQEVSDCYYVSTSDCQSAQIYSAEITDDIYGYGGDIEITMSGLGPFTFQWSNGATTQSLENVPSGTYAVTITNPYDCVLSQQYSIAGCYGGSDISINYDFSNTAPCGYGLSGTLSYHIVDGTAPFDIEIRRLVYNGVSGEYSDDLFSVQSTYERDWVFFNVDQKAIYEIKVVDNNLECLIDKVFIPCSCDYFAPRAAGQDVCMEYLLERSKLFYVQGRIITEENSYYGQHIPDSLVFTVQWPNGEYTQFIWGDPPFHGPEEIIIHEPGTYCITITDPFGCMYIDCVSFGDETTCLIHVYDYTQSVIENFYGVEYDLDYYYYFVRYGCGYCTGCGPQSDCTDFCTLSDDPVAYRPIDTPDPTDPCRGLKFICPLEYNGQEYEAPSWAFYTEFVNWDTEPYYNGNGSCVYPCGCLYPEGTIPGISDAVWVETEIVIPSELCGDPPITEECVDILYQPITYGSLDVPQCSVLVICFSTGEVLDTIVGQEHVCFIENGNGTCDQLLICTNTHQILETLETGIPCEDVDYDSDCSNYGINPLGSPDPSEVRARSKSSISGSYSRPSNIYLDVRPNPFGSYIEVVVRCNPEISSTSSLLVVNGLGMEVYRERMLNFVNGELNLAIDMQEFNAGIYFLFFISENGATSRLIVKQ